MSESPLINSRRRYSKSTFTPVRLPPSVDGPSDLVGLAGLVRSLDITPEEVSRMRAAVVGHATEEVLAVDAIAALVAAPSVDQALAATAALGAINRAILSGAIAQLQAIRAKAIADALEVIDTPTTQASVLPPADAPVPSAGTMPAVTAPPMSSGPSSFDTTTVNFHVPLSVDVAQGIGATSHNMSFNRPSFALTNAAAVRRNALLPPRAAPTAQRRAASSFASIAATQSFEMNRVDISRFYAIVSRYVAPGTDIASMDPMAALEEVDRRRGACSIVIDALSRRAVEPLGLLHLESLEMTPAAIERGELVYSLPLAPKEKVTLAHKEWALRETQFSDFVQDSLEEFSERGVAETDEIAVASQRESRRTDSTGMGASGGVNLTASADGSSSSVVSSAESTQESRSHARSVTSSASSRSIRDHKVSFAVSSTTGSEETSARIIENPSAERAMRIDYFRRMRRWNVELRRVGVRLTYDIVVPDPGRRLRARHDLVRKYDQALLARFDPMVAPADVSHDNFLEYARAYGAILTAPPGSDPNQANYKQWQLASFATLRDAAYARYAQVQDTIRQRRADLLRQIDVANDPSSLRRLEREQMMYAALRWLIPGFPGQTDLDNVDASALGDASWRYVLEFGEYVKFVHAAIDWDQLVTFLYPYFWSGRGGTMDRLFLRHADPQHQEFLRAGAARIILPIRAGYEDEMSSFIDQGKLGTLPQAHRFRTIIGAVKEANAAFAAGDGEGEAGAVIGRWSEYTPTGALDIDVTTMAMLEG